MRRRTKVLLAATLFYIVGSGPAWAGVAAEPTSPDGLAGLFTLPDLASDRGPTLFEDVEGKQYGLYTDLGRTDVGSKTAAVIYEPLSQIGALLVRLAVGLTWWLNTLTSTDVGVVQLGTSLRDVAADLNVWLLPSALAIGMVIAYAKSRSGQEALSQVAWTLGLGIAAVAISTSAPTILNTADDARQLLSTTAATAGTDAITESEVPFKWEGSDVESGDDQSNVTRASGDAVWRSFAVVPWCQAQFGSQAACKRYGPAWLELKSDKERADYIEKVIEKQEGGSDAPTVKFIKGERGGDRITVSIFAVLNGIGVLFVVGGLALLALMPWVTAILLSYLSVVFLCALAIPGRVRQIGLDFLNMLGGLTLLSALTTGILTGALIAVNAATSVAPVQGWLPSAILTTAILFAAWQARSLLERMLFVSGAGSGRAGVFATMMGLAATRRLMSGASRLARGGGSKSSGGRGRQGSQNRPSGRRGTQEGGRTGGALGRPGGLQFFRGRTAQADQTGQRSGRQQQQQARNHGGNRHGTSTNRGGSSTNHGGVSTGEQQGGGSAHQPQQSRGGFYDRARSTRRSGDQARARERLQQRESSGGKSRGTYRQSSQYQDPSPKAEHSKPPTTPAQQRMNERKSNRTYQRSKNPAAAGKGRRRFSRERRRRDGGGDQQ